MSPSPPKPDVHISALRIEGVDARMARRVGPTVAEALERSWREGRLRDGHVPRLRLMLPPDADAAEIARAVARALEKVR